MEIQGVDEEFNFIAVKLLAVLVSVVLSNNIVTT